MMKRLTVLSATIAGLCGLAGAAQAQSCEPKIGHPPLVRKGVIIAAINPTVAPIQYINDDGEIVGLDVDLGNAIAARLCLKMQFQSTQFATMIPILKEGRIDLINSFMFYTPERASQVLMVPYGASSLAIVASEEEHRRRSTASSISPASLSRPNSAPSTTQDAKKASEALVKAGKPAIDCAPSAPTPTSCRPFRPTRLPARSSVSSRPSTTEEGRRLLPVAVGGLEPHAEALAFKDPALAEAVIKVMNEMKADGSFDKIFEPYGHCVLPGPYKVTSGPLPPFTCPSRKD